ncbi:hypothetical protein GBA52_027336 [Prunus armeniaca]|nr:hypothetical protein GBA52_027336 [Prunus armeniaca]
MQGVTEALKDQITSVVDGVCGNVLGEGLGALVELEGSEDVEGESLALEGCRREHRGRKMACEYEVSVGAFPELMKLEVYQKHSEKPRFGSVPWAETSCGLRSIPAAGLGHLEALDPLEMFFCSS